MFDLPLRRFLIVHDQAARRAMHCLADHQFANLGLIGPFHERPNLSTRIAEPSKRAQFFGIAEHKSWPFNGFRLPGVRHAARGLTAIEPNLAMRTIAEWFAFRMTTAAKRVAGFRVK